MVSCELALSSEDIFSMLSWSSIYFLYYDYHLEYKQEFMAAAEPLEELMVAILNEAANFREKTADRKNIMNYHTRGQMGNTIIDYREEFEQVQNE